ncbi:cyclase [Acrocarpospora pleiomorpha]|uniref:Cyclase n=1 Tax=Acrocarpospora pleiomorpha TaxID=90975 RepID=A0A5M3XTQ8_9ACTN|nr:cyclase family protein [Acrocarpospora pleiomorpha]GES24627.1 cyclase [Acrocarpospora pleiomorpha]
MDLPKYADLPPAELGGRSAWGLWGERDSLGRLNLQGADAVLRGGRLVRRGALFPLNAPIDLLDPPLYRRPRVEHTVVNKNGKSLDDALHHFAPQASSQWDALGHVSYSPDVFYGGVTAGELLAEHVGTIEHWAKKGIAGRGVLLDMSSHLTVRGVTAGDSVAFTADDLERALTATGLTLEQGDVLLIRTGFLSWYLEQGVDVRTTLSDRTGLKAAGIDHSEEMAEWLWDSGVAAIASDSPSVEVWPPDEASGSVFGLLHRVLIGQLGFPIGELWWLDDLAADCARTNDYEMFLVSAPLHVPGGLGSTANAIAIR